MKLDRQDYKDSTRAEALAQGCDVCQLKYDGWWTRIEIKNGFVDFYSRTGRKFKSFCFADVELECILVGETMQGTQWSQDPTRVGRTFLFDIWKYDGVMLYGQEYVLRYRFLKLVMSRLPDSFSLVDNYPMSQADELWTGLVQTGAYEGLVYRRRKDFVDVTLLREKNVITRDLKAIGFIEGEGKHAGRLGAIRGETPEGVLVDVGGGFTDQQREEIWYLQDRLLGHYFEVEARAVFDSGSLRHPNFTRWRNDKL
jgi:ATP-dependent DNA ligase